MLCRGAGLIFLILFFSGCAYLDEPRWAMLGDTNEQAFFIDQEKVQRLPDDSYSYQVKVYRYEEGHVHKNDEGHDTNRLLIVEMNCRERQWTETGSSVMDQNGKVLFRRLILMPPSHPVEQGTIHESAFNYLCGDDSVIAQHNH